MIKVWQSFSSSWDVNCGSKWHLNMLKVNGNEKKLSHGCYRQKQSYLLDSSLVSRMSGTWKSWNHIIFWIGKCTNNFYHHGFLNYTNFEGYSSYYHTLLTHLMYNWQLRPPKICLVHYIFNVNWIGVHHDKKTFHDSGALKVKLMHVSIEWFLSSPVFNTFWYLTFNLWAIEGMITVKLDDWGSSANTCSVFIGRPRLTS